MKKILLLFGIVFTFLLILNPISNGIKSVKAESGLSNKILFFSMREGVGSGIFMMNPDGSDQQPLFVPKIEEQAPTFFGISFSKNGEKIAIEVNPNATSHFSLWLLEVNNERINNSADIFSLDPVDCFTYPFASRLTCTKSFFSTGFMNFHPSISPDNKKVAYSFREQGPVEIFMSNIDGSEQKNITKDGTMISPNMKITTNIEELKKMNKNPPKPIMFYLNGRKISFSPDGKKLLFTSVRDGSSEDMFAELYVMNLDKTGLKRLTNNKFPDFDASFSSDGKRIVFDSKHGVNFQIYVMNSDGNGEKQLTNNTNVDNITPCFSPDGKKIVYVAIDKQAEGNPGSIYIMNVDGSEKTRLSSESSGGWQNDYAPVFAGTSNWMRRATN